jgi:small subunit ribosomal protein S17e
MGRIKSKWQKMVSSDLLAKFPEKFGNSFVQNKESLKALNLIEDKSVRNKIAGYICVQSRKKQF